MAAYERGDLTTGTASGAAALEIRAGANDPLYIEELGLFLNAATASLLGFGRPANTPAGGTVGLGDADLGGDEAASAGGVVLSGWTTAPTAPTIYKRQVALPAAIGNGVIWRWGGEGLRVKAGTSMVVWNLQLNSALRYYVRFRD